MKISEEITSREGIPPSPFARNDLSLGHSVAIDNAVPTEEEE
jgi:hypothetical protein